MTSHSDNLPGARPSRGTIRIGQVLSSGRGANAGLFLHPQGHRLVSAWCGADSALSYWAVDAVRQLGSYEVPAELADMGAALSPGLVPAGADKNRDAWPTHVLPVVDSAMSTGGELVAAAAGRAVQLFRADSAETGLAPDGALRGHEEPVARVALDTSGARALSTDGRGNVLVWNVGSRTPLHRLRISKVPTVARFIWNDMLAMVGDDTGRVVCWELKRGRRHLQFQAHHGPLTAAAFNTDSGTLLTAGADRGARMWNLELGKQIGSDMCHPGVIQDAVFAYAGRFVVTCGGDGHIAVWNSTDGDLIDWYFDSNPVYRVAFDPLNGTVVAAGARTLKVLTVDWQRLRELDADARARVVDISMADHAALFSQPPTQPAVTHTGPSAPIGSVLAARQTADLPFPDRSNLKLERGPAPAPPAPAPPAPAAPSPWGGGAAPRTQAISMVGADDPRSAGPQGAAPLAGAGFGSLAAAVESTNLTAGGSANPSPTSYGTAGNSNAADAFFRQLGEGARHSRMDTDGVSDLLSASPKPDESVPAQPAPPEPAPAVAGSGVLPGGIATRPTPAARAPLRAPVRTTEAPVAEPAPAPVDLIREVRRRLMIGVAIVVVLTASIWVGTRSWYTTQGYPEAVRLQADSAQVEYEQAESAARASFEAFEQQQQTQLRDYERRSLPAAELERITSRIERRIADREEEVREQTWVAEQARDRRLAELEEDRRAAAGQLAGRSAGIGGLVLLLMVALWIARATRPRET